MNTLGRKASGLLLVSLGLLLLPGACTVVVNESELQEGCSDDTKVCPSMETGELECVSITNPNYGCGEDICVPCSLPHASWRCSSEEAVCVIAACNGSYKDCDGKRENGCEVDTGHDEENCGGCDVKCSAANAATVCNEGTCTITICQEGFADCDHKPSNGCEVDTTTSNKHCGGCNQLCAGTCSEGVCL